MKNEPQIRIALGVLSGRRNMMNLSALDLETLGYDLHNLQRQVSAEGPPHISEVKEMAEQVIYDALVKD